MEINYEKATTAIISHLEQAGHDAGTIAVYRRCYDGVREHLVAIGLPFTMDVALDWLEIWKLEWSYHTYCQYRSALYRLEIYLSKGCVCHIRCYSIEQFSCRDTALKLPKAIRELYEEFKSILRARLNKANAYFYTQGCKEFLLFVAERGCNTPAVITIENIIEFSAHFRGTTSRIVNKKAGHLAGIGNLLIHIAEHGDIPRCYASVLTRKSAELHLSALKLDAVGTAFQPSKKLEPLVAEFLSSLDEQNYSAAVKVKYMHDFTNYFLFIEINHLEYTPVSVALWLENSPHNATREHRRHTLTLFADYLSTGSTNKEYCYTWRSLLIDSLPDWSRNIILSFVAERQREGFSRSTLKMCRVASCRFFHFLDTKGICEPQEITTELVKEFHNADRHSTPLGKNTYGIKVRQLLSYMAEKKMVPQHLYLAISTQCAPCRNIVNVMTEDMESAVYQYRTSATTPFELRNAAIVMLGLHMGMRASDIVNLKIGDINWQEQTVSFVQKKTNKAIKLPVPVDVANSVYKYIMEGRPQSGVKGEGYVFIRHRAPFNGMDTSQACRYALKQIMSTHGITLLPGQGFHITRKTFATRLLTSRNSIDDISNVLGHAMQKTAESYLSRDEEGMRLCPLPFESVGVV